MDVEVMAMLSGYKVEDSFGFFIWWDINLLGLFNTKAILLEQQWYYLNHSWGNKGIHTN